jgi:hypothetical protein
VVLPPGGPGPEQLEERARESLKSPAAAEDTDMVAEAMPVVFDWRNVDGRSYITNIQDRCLRGVCRQRALEAASSVRRPDG